MYYNSIKYNTIFNKYTMYRIIGVLIFFCTFFIVHYYVLLYNVYIKFMIDNDYFKDIN